MASKTEQTVSTLRTQLENSRGPKEGTVIRFIRDEKYAYVAIYVIGMWFTSAQHYNTIVEGRLTHPQMLQLLASTRTSKVKVATRWEAL